MFAHTTDLTVKPLNQRNTKHKRRFFLHLTFFGDGAENRHTGPHPTDKVISDRLIDRHQILFFVIVTGTQDFIHQVAVVGQKDKSLRIFVQTTNWKHALAVIHEINNVVALAVFGGADNPYRLIQRDKNQIFRFTRLNQPTIYFYDVARHHLIADGGAFTIQEDIPLFDKAIRLAARADSAFTDVFI